MRFLRRALVFVAIVTLAIASLPVSTGAARHCPGCCADMAPCCQMAPASPATPARTPDAQSLAPQPSQLASWTAAIAIGSLQGAGVSDRYVYRLRFAVLRI